MTARRANWLMAVCAGVLLISVGVVAGRVAVGDDASARAGREYGSNQAVMYRQINHADPSDNDLLEWCHEGAKLSADTQIWYRGGVIQVGELDRQRFADGCFESYRDGVR
ncbi:hypothetical protein C8K36_101302 [Rhodococcus sp. OK519]|uniref:succinate dehydrogenase n=1 Tax=Rhodococcus sp. OK519 TaxID=2135729 RepID=UPI000D37803B|nr:hypothetical protein C8K36_101302 [Rhodococcus sp. OK519]